MRTPQTWLQLLIAVGFLLLGAGPSAWGEEEPPTGDEAEEEEGEDAEPLSPEEARRLEQLLTKAAKARKLEDTLEALDEVGEQTHPSFQKPLLKMLTHESSRVAMRAADMLGWQRIESEKEGKKLGKSIWKKGFSDRKNHRRPNVKGRIILATAAVEDGAEFDAPRFKEVERHWRAVMGDPKEANAPAIISVCEYVRLTKDKRFCRMLAEAIDEPGTTAVNSPTNPPAEWWERCWKMWKQYKAEVVESLEELTGESFKDTASAKAWFEANRKESGFRW